MNRSEALKGMKVKIPTQNTKHKTFSFPLFQQELKEFEVYPEYLVLRTVDHYNGIYGVYGPNGEYIHNNSFNLEDLDPYQGEQPHTSYVAGQLVKEGEPIKQLERLPDTILVSGKLDDEIEDKITESEEEFSATTSKDEFPTPQLIDSTRDLRNDGRIQIEEKGLRFNEGKLDYSLLDLSAFSTMIEVLEFGAKKYSRDNWKVGGEKWGIMGIMSSLLRHMAQLMSGELIDKESGLPHVGHIQCNVMFLGYFWNKHLETLKSKKKSNFLKDLFKPKKS